MKRNILAGLLAFSSVIAGLPQLWPSEESSSINPVLALPPGYRIDAPIEPYSGPHPAQLSRPTDPTPFPIALGAIGPAEPLFAGPLQYPFACDTAPSGLGQPEVDNDEGIGTAVVASHKDSKTVIGYSRDCLARTQAWYYYKRRGSDDFALWYPHVMDMDYATVNERSVPFIVRVEMGTISRFVYFVAALRGNDESLATPTPDNWNRRLIYQFRGGVGIGFRQGKVKAANLLKDRVQELARGYAIAHSSGNTTSYHYNIWLAEDTALRVKRQFVALYGEPLYTVGVGGSGGGLQQYLLAQNRPGLIDAAIAQLAYPDMVTQIIPVFDCELLEYHFDVTARKDQFWRNAEHRRLIEGFNGNNQAPESERFSAIKQVSALASLINGDRPQRHWVPTECAASWRGLTPLVLNPRYSHFSDRFAKPLAAQVRWSHFEDLKHFYGTGPDGYARVPWDNVGVQYGLVALQRGQITVEQFLRLNRHVGGWKKPADMHAEHYWKLVGDDALKDFSPWSAHNMRRGSKGQPAPRSRGDSLAIAAAYRSGLVFLGKIDIPVIDVRYYLEPDLDMHHASASFSTRMRLLREQGHHHNQVIWVSDKRFDPTVDAFAAIDQWLTELRTTTQEKWQNPPPTSVSDRCFAQNGEVIASGESVWNGQWNGKTDGACMRTYPIYGTSRTMAGDDLTGDRFKCVLQSVDDAIANGVYGPIDMRPHRDELEKIFPDGVCDYRQRAEPLAANLLALP